MRRNIPPLLAELVAVLSLICANSCAVPLAPGYQIAKETREIHFVTEQRPELEIRADFTLVNSGTTPLTFIDVALPSEQATGRSDLRVHVDGREAVAAPLPAMEQHAEMDLFRVNFEQPWTRKQKREVSFEYALRPPEGSDSSAAIGPGNFHVGVRGWAPQLAAPKHFLAPSPSQPPRVEYFVRVPADFVVLAGGALKGQKKDGNEIEYRYELRRQDLGAFAVAGRYARWPAGEVRNSVKFWTLKPLAVNPSASAERIGEIWKTLTTDFGELDKRIQAPEIVESSSVSDDVAEDKGPAATSFPGGALVNSAAFALGTSSDRFLQIVSQALARNWFDEVVVPSADSAIGMGEGLPEYADIVTEEARDGSLARRRRIYEYLRQYDAAAKYADETPLGATTLSSPVAERRIALAKAPLFYIEMEDACGEAPVRAGLAHMVASLRGQEVDYKVLRSALEESTGRDLGKLFREWLNQKGIPETFRARYRYGDGSREIGN